VATWVNKHNLPAPLVAAIKNDRYVKVGNISVTGLISPPRKRVLEKRNWNRITIDVADEVYRVLGQGVHAVLERSATANGISEKRMTAEVNGWIVSGQPDWYESHVIDGGVLHDYKLTGTFQAQREEKSDWERQLNIYAWFYRLNGVQVDKAFICAILRDWKRSQAKRDPTYPQSGVKMIEVPLWPQEQVQAFVEERVKLHQQAEVLGDAELPNCTQEERWQQPAQHAVIKGDNKRAFRVYDTFEEADNMLKIIESSGGKGRIQYRPAEAIRCEGYCKAAPWCSQRLAEIPMGLESVSNIK